MNSSYLNELADVCADDALALVNAQKNYGDSWKQRGGVGAFMMLARKWDRIEKRLHAPPTDSQGAAAFSQYDIFGAVASDKRPEGIIDDIRDLRRYLILVECHMRFIGQCPGALPKDIAEGAASKGMTGRKADLADLKLQVDMDDTPGAGSLHPK